ncbi:MAG TPA: glycosyltransferase family 2 protein [Kiritimatiellia bacterium]|nr:glycosyltransferase family 2 protein [Kiritimatiellia bacterium]HRZ11051.1 glycosyltransferase family 2 protein [Kiritimatiellia bacterium]HSA18624.1 glycosyltransferase family 2 protein [Kiritimatiellia bacterium]
MKRSSHLAVIVPVFNEREAVGPVLEALVRFAENRDMEIIAVDDGSDDGTDKVLAGLGERVIVRRHSSNRGYGASLKTGILATQARNVLFFDSDGQHDVADLPRLLEELERHECVFGARPPGAGIPLVRKPGKWLLQHVCQFLAGRKIPDLNCGLRAGRRLLFMRMLDLLPEGFSFSITSLMFVIKSRHSYVFVPVHCGPRVGKSSVRIFSDGIKAVLLALRLVMLFDPLRVLGVPAVALMTVGAVYQLYEIMAFRLKIVGGAILAILAGVILFLFGLLADQIASLRKEISSHNSLFWELEQQRGKNGDE